MMQFLDKYKSMNEPAKASLWYAICSIIQKGISFIVVPIYVRLLTTTEYGQYTVFQSWRDVLVVIVTLNLYCGVFTKAMVDYDKQRDRYTSSMQGLTTVLIVTWFIVFLFFKQLVIDFLDMDSTTMVLLFLFFLVYPSISFWSVQQRVEYKYKELIVVTLVISLLTPVISICLLYVTNLKANAVIWGYLFTQIAFGLFFYILQFAKGKCFFDKEYWIHALKFNLPLIPHYLSLIVLAQADRIMIKAMCGADKAGIYGLAYSVAMLMNIITTSVNGSFVPWVYNKLKLNDLKPIANVSNKLCVAIGLMTFVATLISPEIVRILGTEEYYDAIWIIPAVSISVYLTFCYGLYANIEFYYSKTKYVMIASTVGAIMNIILNRIFIAKYGYLAAGFTTLASYIILMMMHFLYARRIMKEKLNGKQVYDNKFILGSSLILLIIMFMCMVSYGNTLVRYGAIVICLIIIFIFRKNIKALIGAIK